MKKSIHPDNYQLVILRDLKQRRPHPNPQHRQGRRRPREDGKEYPSQSPLSAPLRTPSTPVKSVLDLEGRVDKFKAALSCWRCHKEKRRCRQKPLAVLPPSAKGADQLEADAQRYIHKRPCLRGLFVYRIVVEQKEPTSIDKNRPI